MQQQQQNVRQEPQVIYYNTREELYFGPVTACACVTGFFFIGPLALLACFCPCDRRTTNAQVRVVDRFGQELHAVDAYQNPSRQTMRAVEPMQPLPEERSSSATQQKT
jgi:hypothetical protein